MKYGLDALKLVFNPKKGRAMYHFNHQYVNELMYQQASFSVPMLPWIPDGTIITYAIGNIEGSGVSAAGVLLIEAPENELIDSDTLVISGLMDPDLIPWSV